MNKVNVYNSKGISECFNCMCSSNSVELEFELQHRGITTNEEVARICKILNTAYNDGQIYYKDWVVVSRFDKALLLKSVDSYGNNKYIEIVEKEGM